MTEAMDTVITKRLHISGLTPAITADDISKRLSTFGTVKNVDGVGLQDGIGQPRKFGYVTIETTTGKLSKCLNLLSGSTWKGTKLRLGEAKPDFAERIATEHQLASEEPPKKRRKKFGAVHAEDMSIITPENVTGRGGWKVTPLGRIVKPIRMRPERPLPPVQEEKSKKVKVAGKRRDDLEKKKKRRVKEPDTRARRRTIDMTKWGSVQLKGMFLDLEVQAASKTDMSRDFDMVGETTGGSASESEADDEAEASEVPAPIPTLPSVKEPLTVAVPPAVPSVTPTPRAPTPTHQPVPSASKSVLEESSSILDAENDVALEKSKSLNLLASLFNGDDEDWIGKESVGSDVDEDELLKHDSMMVDADEGDFEVVPVDKPQRVKETRVEQIAQDDGDKDEDEDEVTDATEKAPTPQSASPKRPKESAQTTKLKDLFAPREEEAGFSLLGHLDLDLELDDEVVFGSEQPTQASIPVAMPSFTLPVTSATQTYTHAPITLDPKQPLFFPLPTASRASIKARPKDLFDLAMDNGWNWRDPSLAFYKTGTEEDIKKQWEEERGELTQGWTKRWREAGKVSRRRGRGAGVDGDAE